MEPEVSIFGFGFGDDEMILALKRIEVGGGDDVLNKLGFGYWIQNPIFLSFPVFFSDLSQSNTIASDADTYKVGFFFTL